MAKMVLRFVQAPRFTGCPPRAIKIGGDEFSFLLEHCPLEQAERIAEELLDTVNSYRFQWEDDSFRIGLSIGFTSVSNDSGDAAHVLARANAACRNAKSSGRNCVRVYAPGKNSDLAADTRWAERLHQALEADEFELHLQPIYALPLPDEGTLEPAQVVAHEAYVRLRTVSDGLVLQGAFLTAAARFELAPAIDMWVLRTLASHLRNADGPSQPTNVHLNVGATTLQSQAYSRLLDTLVKARPELAQQISLEMTEADVLSNPQAAQDFAEAVRHLGLGIVIDRFGTGVASFQQLRALAPDIVKLDVDLIAALDDTTGQAHVVRAVCEV